MKKLLSLLALVLITGCQSVAERVEVPPDQQAKALSFQYPIVAKPDEAVVYVVNKPGKNPSWEKWDNGLIFETAFEIKGAAAPVATIPGEYAVLKIKPGTYEPWASRICHGEKGATMPPAGTVMKVREPGWVTFSHFYGRKFSKSDQLFEFLPGKTYVFSLYVNCAMVVQAGGVMFYPRILEVDEAGGKYLLMNSKPATRNR